MLLEKLQRLPAQYHWVFADGALLNAIIHNTPVGRGKRGRQLTGMVKLACRFALAWPFIWLVSVVEFLILFFRQRRSIRNGKNKIVDYPAYFFVGFGAGNEEKIFQLYSEQHKGRGVGRLDETDIATFADWHTVGLKDGLVSLFSALTVAKQAIDVLPPELIEWRIDFLTHIAKQGGYFAYMHAWFSILEVKQKGRVNEVAFLSAFTPAFAAAVTGISTCYLQHGMIRHSTLLPNFTTVIALTEDESAFMQKRLPQAQLTVRKQVRPAILPALMARSVLIASIYGEVAYLSQILPFLEWLHALPVPVKVRPHPCENGLFWAEHELSGAVSIEKNDPGFYSALERLKPRLVVSWFSTALDDALMSGVIPVSVCSDDDRSVSDMVYPLFQRCLRWPTDRETIRHLLGEDNAYYEKVLLRLRKGLNDL